MIVSSIVFFGPISAIGAIYCYIMYYIKHTTNSAIHQNRQQANQRDFIVLRPNRILVGILTILSIPTITLWLYYLITGYLNPLTPHIEWLINSISFLILSIAFLFLSPQLREVLSFAWRHNRRVQPVMIIQSH
jgi:threonine/homoserine/homoserine lactone efflux protein